MPRFLVTRRLASMVEEAVERKPFKKPKVVEVETPQSVGVHAKVPLPLLVGQEVRQSDEMQIVLKVALVKVPSLVSWLKTLERWSTSLSD